jgi:hypothetical protein
LGGDFFCVEMDEIYGGPARVILLCEQTCYAQQSPLPPEKLEQHGRYEKRAALSL